MAPPTFLIAGATGNTGRGVVETLSQLLQAKGNLSGYRILALSRSSKGEVAQKFAQLPHVELHEKSWVEVTPDWLREHNVERAFIASHLQPNQFAEESTFHLACLNAGVKYVVRVSTGATAVRPDNKTYYPRTHWAIETMLSTPEFEGLQWTSLQPNAFTPTWFYTAVDFIKNFQKTGKQGTLAMMPSKDTPVGVIDPFDIGVVAAHLLVDENFSKHNKKKYVLNGPEDITGEQIVQMVEQRIGTKVENVVYQDMSLADAMAAASSESKNVILSIKHSVENIWQGKAKADTTSKETVDMGVIKTTPAQAFDALLK